MKKSFISFFFFVLGWIFLIRAEVWGLEEPPGLARLRDPFRMPEVVLKPSGPRTELERYPIDAYRLIGVLAGADRRRALFLGPNGKTYFVREGEKIGIRGESIAKITPDSVRIRTQSLGKAQEIELYLDLWTEKESQQEWGGS